MNKGKIISFWNIESIIPPIPFCSFCVWFNKYIWRWLDFVQKHEFDINMCDFIDAHLHKQTLDSPHPHANPHNTTSEYMKTNLIPWYFVNSTTPLPKSGTLPNPASNLESEN